MLSSSCERTGVFVRNGSLQKKSQTTDLEILRFEHRQQVEPLVLVVVFQYLRDVATPHDLGDGEYDLRAVHQDPVLAVTCQEVADRQLDELTQVDEHRLLHLAQPHLNVATSVQTLRDKHWQIE